MVNTGYSDNSPLDECIQSKKPTFPWVLCINFKLLFIPVSILHKPEVSLRDYIQQSIWVGAIVDLLIVFYEKNAVVPIYFQVASMLDQNPACWG